MPGPEAREFSPNPQNEFDLERGLLGPNLRLRSQLTPEQEKEFFEDPSILLATYYPHSTLGRQGIFATGEIYADCYRAFGLERLSKISQVGEVIFLLEKELPTITDERVREIIIKGSRAFTSTHRWAHSLATGILSEVMLRNNHFSEEEIKTDIIAGNLHDAAVTPLSDLVSGLNQKELDEAEALPLYLQGISGEDRDFFEHKYAPDYRAIIAAARGRGQLGAFLKIADRLAYTAYDSVFYTILLNHNRRFEKTGESPLEELVDIFKSRPNLFDIFREVKFDPETGQVYFENPQNLALALRVRALMYRHVYLNPQRLGFQAIVRRTTQDLMDKGKFTHEELFRMNDLSFLAKVHPYLPFSRSEVYQKIGSVKGKSVRKVERVLKRSRKSEEVIWAEEVSGFNTLTYWLVKDPQDGQIKPFSEACPKEAAELEDLNRQTQGAVAYFAK